MTMFKIFYILNHLIKKISYEARQYYSLLDVDSVLTLKSCLGGKWKWCTS